MQLRVGALGQNDGGTECQLGVSGAVGGQQDLVGRCSRQRPSFSVGDLERCSMPRYYYSVREGRYSRKLGFRCRVFSVVELVGAACTLYLIFCCVVSGGDPIQPRIRPFDDRDSEAVVDLSLQAWAPVFASLEQALGSEVFRRLHPDWREDQRRAVEDICAAQKGRVWSPR